jgi:Fur family transcriptional regulator, ferric uptake regulator
MNFKIILKLEEGRMPEKGLRRLLRERGLKATRQRDEVVRALEEAGAHVTVAELYERLRRKNPRIGYATVYRTLRLLSETGWAAARRFEDGTSRFERREAGKHHDHLICLGCGKIQEFEDGRLEALQERIARREGFRVREHKLELYGYCRDCAEKSRGGRCAPGGSGKQHV